MNLASEGRSASVGKAHDLVEERPKDIRVHSIRCHVGTIIHVRHLPQTECVPASEPRQGKVATHQKGKIIELAGRRPAALADDALILQLRRKKTSPGGTLDTSNLAGLRKCKESTHLARIQHTRLVLSATHLLIVGLRVG